MAQRLDWTSMSVLKWAFNLHSNPFVTYMKDALIIKTGGSVKYVDSGNSKLGFVTNFVF